VAEQGGPFWSRAIDLAGGKKKTRLQRLTLTAKIEKEEIVLKIGQGCGGGGGGGGWGGGGKKRTPPQKVAFYTNLERKTFAEH